MIHFYEKYRLNRVKIKTGKHWKMRYSGQSSNSFTYGSPDPVAEFNLIKEYDTFQDNK